MLIWNYLPKRKYEWPEAMKNIRCFQNLLKRTWAHVKWLVHKSHLCSPGWTVTTLSALVMRPISQVKKNVRLVVFVPLCQIQQWALISPIKWERKLESKPLESPDSNLSPETTRPGCCFLKQPFEPGKTKPQKVASAILLIYFYLFYLFLFVYFICLTGFPKLWMLTWMLPELFTSRGRAKTGLQISRKTNVLVSVSGWPALGQARDTLAIPPAGLLRVCCGWTVETVGGSPRWKMVG